MFVTLKCKINIVLCSSQILHDQDYQLQSHSLTYGSLYLCVCDAFVIETERVMEGFCWTHASSALQKL